jgi:hypothetical protein
VWLPSRTFARLEVAETPWSSVCDVGIKDRRGGRARLWFEKRTPRWSLGKTYCVDAEVECTAEQSAALRRRVEAWRGAAEHPSRPADSKPTLPAAV